MKTIALFGGSFDPPHIAHELIVEEALKIEDVDKVVVMPTFLNPFKSTSFAPSTLRLKWLKNIFSDYENVIIDSFEVDKKEKVPSLVTVKYLLEKYSKVYLIIGADNLEHLDKWHHFNELKNLVTFLVATRSGVKVSSDFMQLNIQENVSSTQLRNTMNSLKLSKKNEKEIIEFYKDKNE